MNTHCRGNISVKLRAITSASPLHVKRAQHMGLLLGVMAVAAPVQAIYAAQQHTNPASPPENTNIHRRTAIQDAVAKNMRSKSLAPILITGLRQSLQSSMRLKENATQVVDAITQQGIGQFPNPDVADALSRLPDISLTHDATGSGNEITIRGFGPQFNLVLLNGMELPTQTGGRQFNFDVLPSEAISRAVVYKTSEAWQPADAIGGLVEMQTAQPFDFKGPKLVAKISGNMNTHSSKVEPSEFLLLSNTFDHQKFGALLSIASQEQATTTYDLSGAGFFSQPVNGPGEPTAVWQTGSGASGLPSSVLLPVTDGVNSNYYNTKRLSVNAALQWHVTSNVTATLDGMYNKYTEFNYSNDLGLYVDGNPINNGVVVRPDGVVQSFTTQSHADLIQSTGGDQISPQYLRTILFKLKGNAFDHKLLWDLAASYGTNTASNYLDPSVFSVAGFPIPVSYTSNGGVGVPTLGTTSSLTDISLPHAHFTEVSATSNVNDITQLRTNETWVVPNSWGPLTDIRFGAAWKRNKYVTFSSYNSGDVCAYCGYRAQLPGYLFTPTSVAGNFASPYPGSFPTTWLTYNPAQYLAFLQSSTAFAEQDAAGNLPPGTTAAAVQGSGGYVPQSVNQAPQDLANISEKSYSAYIQGDFGGRIFGLAWGGNLGLRLDHTSAASTGYGQVLQDITPIPNDPTGDNAIYANNGAVLEQTASHSYTYALPSFNWRLTLPRHVVVRAAVSKTMARPQPSDLSPVINYGGSIVSPSELTASGGNPNLTPYTSLNYDFGLEWYFSRDGYVAADGFVKKLSNFIELLQSPIAVPITNSQHLAQFPGNVATFQLTAPTNVGSATVKGVGVAAQYMFVHLLPGPFDGLGITANATFLSTNAGVNSIGASASGTQQFGLTGLGNLENVTLIYQKYGISARVAYSRRGQHIVAIGDGVSALAPIYEKAYSELDAQIAYTVNSHITVALSGANLTNAVIQQYDTRTDEFYNLVNYGTRYEMSVTATF